MDVPVITLNQVTANGKRAINREVLPLVDIREPTDNDVLSGRGVTTNKHAGNVNFRSLVALNKELYVTSTKKQKMAISRSIVDAVRSMNPAGRFLEKSADTGLWSDIGDRKAIEKTSQALRDGAAVLRKQLSEDLGDPDFLSVVFERDNSTSSTASDGSAASDSSSIKNGSSCNDNSELTRNQLAQEQSQSTSSKSRRMKSTMAKKGNRTVKTVDDSTNVAPFNESKKLPKKTRLDQDAKGTPQSNQTMSKSSLDLQKQTNNESLGDFAPPTNAVTPCTDTTTPGRNGSTMEPDDGDLIDDDFGSNSNPWLRGHSRNSSTSNGMAIPSYLSTPPIGRQHHHPTGRQPHPGQPEQHLFSNFYDSKSSNNSHRSWLSRECQDSSTFHDMRYERHNNGEPTYFSDGDIDIQGVDMSFERQFDSPDDRLFCMDDDMSMLPALRVRLNTNSSRTRSFSVDDEMNVVAASRVRLNTNGSRSCTSLSNHKDDMDFRFSPALEYSFTGNKDDFDDVMMLDDDGEDPRILSPLSFARNESSSSDVGLFESVPDFLRLPIVPCAPHLK